MDAFVAAGAREVVAAFLRDRRPPRDTIAALSLLRGAPGPPRAAVARAAAAALAGLRRTWFVLGGGVGGDGLPAPDRAEELVRHAAAAAVAIEPLLVGVPDPMRRFALRHSLPDWFAAAALAQFGDDAPTVAAALAAPAPRTLRANLLRVTDAAALAAELAAEDVPTRPGAFAATALHVDGDADLFATAAFARGAFEQQDEASQLVVAATAPPPGGKVLDLCAGSGGKTLALAAALHNRGEVLATDVHPGRLDALRQRLRRAGAHDVRVVALTEAAGLPPAVSAFAAAADRILVDAPCSGTGSWRRRPEARWGVGAGDLAALRRTQDALLDRAAALLRPGARLVYSTCSLLADENERRIDALLARDPGLQAVRLAEILGGATAAAIGDASGTFLSVRPDRHGCDGFFAAVLRRPRPPRSGQRS